MSTKVMQAGCHAILLARAGRHSFTGQDHGGAGQTMRTVLWNGEVVGDIVSWDASDGVKWATGSAASSGGAASPRADYSSS